MKHREIKTEKKKISRESEQQWDNIKQSNIHEFRVPKGKEIWGGRGQEKTFEEIKAKNFPNLIKTINPQIQGVQIRTE